MLRVWKILSNFRSKNTCFVSFLNHQHGSFSMHGISTKIWYVCLCQLVNSIEFVRACKVFMDEIKSDPCEKKKKIFQVTSHMWLIWVEIDWHQSITVCNYDKTVITKYPHTQFVTMVGIYGDSERLVFAHGFGDYENVKIQRRKNNANFIFKMINFLCNAFGLWLLQSTILRTNTWMNTRARESERTSTALTDWSKCCTTCCVSFFIVCFFSIRPSVVCVRHF